MHAERIEPLKDEAQYVAAARALEHDSRPPLVLRLLMRALERYRSERKMGWSRPQNKEGVVTFRSYTLDATEDATLIGDALACLRAELPGLGRDEARFVAELMEDPKLMGFVFVQDLEEDGRRYETATVSFGRVASTSRRHRDRFDILLDSPIVDGVRRPLSRLRVFIDPFERPSAKHLGWGANIDGPQTSEAHRLLHALAEFDRRYVEDADKRWEHWTSRYVEYFGARQSPVRGTLFPDSVDHLALYRGQDEASRAAAVGEPR